MKIALLGDSGTGKTNLVRRLLNQNFCFTHNITVRVKEELLPLGEDREEITVVDTPGSLSYFDATHDSLQSVDIFVIVFSLTNRKSFDNIENWRSVISEIKSSNPIIWLLGTKTDLLDCCIIDDAEIAASVSRHSYRGVFKLSARHREEVLRTFSSLLQFVNQVARAAKRSVLFAREIKLCVIGLGSAGTSSLLLRFVKDSFSLSNISECQFMHRFLSVSGEKVKMCLHNLSGVPTPCLESFLQDRAFDAVVLVYDVTNLGSLYGLSSLCAALRPLLCLRFLIGTKSDLTDGRAVTAEHLEAFCDRENIDRHFEVSAKTGKNVPDAFSAVSELVLQCSPR